VASATEARLLELNQMLDCQPCPVSAPDAAQKFIFYQAEAGQSTCFQCGIDDDVNIKVARVLQDVDGMPIGCGHKCDAGFAVVDGVCAPCGGPGLRNTLKGDEPGVCVACEAGKYNDDPAAEECKDCEDCPVGYYYNMYSTLRERDDRDTCNAATMCVKCTPCPDPGMVKVNCRNTYNPLGTPLTGECKQASELVPTALCPIQDEIFERDAVIVKSEWQSHYGLGGFTFMEVFGQTPAAADFQCRRVCDGTAMLPRLVDGERKQSYGHIDTGQCDGPFACNVQACSMLSAIESTSATFRQPRGCPAQMPVDMADATGVHTARRAQCEPCELCGSQGISWYTDSVVYGHGCAQECSVLVCPVGTIFDFTRSESATLVDRCVSCEELSSPRLCSAADLRRLGLVFVGISGLRPLIAMQGCQERSASSGAGHITYGTCETCSLSDVVDVAGVGSRFIGACSGNGAPLWRECVAKPSKGRLRELTAMSLLDTDGKANTLFCQVSGCVDQYTGVS